MINHLDLIANKVTYSPEYGTTCVGETYEWYSKIDNSFIAIETDGMLQTNNFDFLLVRSILDLKLIDVQSNHKSSLFQANIAFDPKTNSWVAFTEDTIRFFTIPWVSTIAKRKEVFQEVLSYLEDKPLISNKRLQKYLK